MSSLSQSGIGANGARDTRIASLHRATVFEIFRDHRQLMSVLPGEVSQFEQTDVGYEWRCELALGTAASTSNVLELHFSLVDLAGLPRPAAALYLVEYGVEDGKDDHLALTLEDLEQTHGQLNEQLGSKGARIEALERAGRFVDEVVKLRDSLGHLVTWA